MNINVDISDAIIKTERLVLRPFKESDLQDFFEYASVEGVGEMAGWPHHKNIDESKTLLDIFISEKKTFAIDYNGKVIGSVGIEKYNEDLLPEFFDNKGIEVGFVLSKTYWGNGIMPEAVKGVINYLFNEINLDFIICCHSINNTQSKRVQEKCGFIEYQKNSDKCINILYR